MNPEQVSRFLDLLETIAHKGQTYTITGAADWPILVVMGFMMIAMIGMMWRDLRGGQKEQKDDFEKDVDKLWSGMRDCQNDCCHPRKRGEG